MKTPDVDPRPEYRESELAARLQRESEYHDAKYVSDDGPFIYRANPTYRIFRQMKAALGNVSGMRILEYGCGTGWITVELAELGAELHSFDISQEAVTQTREWVSRHRPEANCQIQQMAAEKLDYPDAHFDLVIGFAILHHLELGLALPELRRVMKPGARALFAEPLGSNPLINLYRRCTPAFRTPDERPLRMRSSLREAAMFRRVAHEEFYFAALLPLAFSAIVEPRRMQVAVERFAAVDRMLFRVLPPVRSWAWYTLLTLHR